MSTRTDGWSRLTTVVEEFGADWLLDAVTTRIAEGEHPRDIALSMGFPWIVLRKWMEDAPDRIAAWNLAKRCFADGLSYEALGKVRDSGLEDVPLVKMQADHYSKVAAKLSREEWGGEAAAVSGFGGGVTIVIGEVKSPYLPAGGNVIEQKVEQKVEEVGGVI